MLLELSFLPVPFTGKLVATTSGTYRNMVSRYGPQMTVDKKADTFYTSGWYLHWLQIDLGSSIIVHTVQATKRSRYFSRFRGVEVS